MRYIKLYEDFDHSLIKDITGDVKTYSDLLSVTNGNSEYVSKIVDPSYLIKILNKLKIQYERYDDEITIYHSMYKYDRKTVEVGMDLVCLEDDYVYVTNSNDTIDGTEEYVVFKLFVEKDYIETFLRCVQNYSSSDINMSIDIYDYLGKYLM